MHRRRTGPAAQIFRNIFHRAGTEQRNRRDDIIEAFRLHFADQILHALRFQLENSNRIDFFQQRIGPSVI